MSSIAQRSEHWLFFSQLLLLIWLPFPLGSHVAWAWSLAELWIALQSLGLLLLYRRKLPWHHLALFKWLLVPLGLFQCWVLVQSIVLPNAWVEWLSPNGSALFRMTGVERQSISVDRVATIMALLRGVSYWLFLFNCIALIHTGDRLKMAVTAIVLSGTMQGFYGAIMVLLKQNQSWFWGYPEVDVATGAFVYKNHFANYLMICLCLGLGLIITQLHVSRSGSWLVRIRRWLHALLSPKMFIRLALIIMVIALVMTRSRMGNAAFFAATALGGLIALSMYRNKPRALTVLILSVLAIDTFIVGTLFGLEKVQQRLIDTSAASESRDQVVMWSLDIVKDFPFTGTGLSTYNAIFPSYSQHYVGYYDYAHNDYLQFLVEAGVPATVMLGATVLYALYLSIRTVNVRQSRTMKGLALGSTMAIFGMLIHITVDFNLQPMANAVTFIFTLFVAVATCHLPAHGRAAFCAIGNKAQNHTL